MRLYKYFSLWCFKQK